MERKKVKNKYGIKERADRSGSQLLGERESGYGQKCRTRTGGRT